MLNGNAIAKNKEGGKTSTQHDPNDDAGKMKSQASNAARSFA